MDLERRGNPEKSFSPDQLPARQPRTKKKHAGAQEVSTTGRDVTVAVPSRPPRTTQRLTPRCRHRDAVVAAIGNPVVVVTPAGPIKAAADEDTNTPSTSGALLIVATNVAEVPTDVCAL